MMACPALVAAQSAPVQAVDKLTMASKCEIQMTVLGGRGGQNDLTMTIENDGGWCWRDTNTPGKKSNKVLTAYYVKVTTPPKHGHVIIGDLPNGEIRVAYQPEPGFAGADSFTIHIDVRDTDATYSVTVSK